MPIDLPKRKQNRLTEYNYSTPNAYFITVCTYKRKNLFWANTVKTVHTPEDILLSEYGTIVDQCIRSIPLHYPSVSIDHYIIMPNHVHLLLQIHTDAGGRSMIAPTISNVIRQMKGMAAKQAGFRIWQKGFYDHVIRNNKDYRVIWLYIEGNPSRWLEDELHTAEHVQ